MSGRKFLSRLLILAGIVLVMYPVPSMAAVVSGPVNIGTPFVVGPGFTCAFPFSQGAYVMNEANTAVLASEYTGSMAIVFSPVTTGQGCSGFSVAPAIAQAVDRDTFYQRSYFFSDYLQG